MPEAEDYNFYGGFATVSKELKTKGNPYSGPNWFTEGMDGVY